MPFLEDNAPDESALRSPIWSAGIYIKDNLEKLVVLNLSWSIHFIPGIVALLLPQMWLGLRILGCLYTATALAAVTGVMYGVVKRVCESDLISLDATKEVFRVLAVPSMRVLAPLYGIFTIWLALFLGGGFFNVLLLQVIGGYGTLIFLLVSLYWGPIFADEPALSSWSILKRSFQLTWRYPAPTLVSALVIGVVLAISVASIAGFFFIVPVVVTVLQTCRYRDVMAR